MIHNRYSDLGSLVPSGIYHTVHTVHPQSHLFFKVLRNFLMSLGMCNFTTSYEPKKLKMPLK